MNENGATERSMGMRTVTFTSASAAKLIKRLENEKSRLIDIEQKNST